MKEKVSLLKIWGAFYPSIIYYFIQIVVVCGYFFIMGCSYVMTHINQNYSDDLFNEEMVAYLSNKLNQDAVLVTIICAMLIMPIVWLLFYLDRRKEKKMGCFRRYDLSPMAYLLIIPTAMFCMFGGSYFSSLCMEFMPASWVESYTEATDVLYSGGIVTQFIGIAFIMPIAEEMIFRGLCYKRLSRCMNVLPAAIISSVFFGIYHGNAVQGIYATLLGLVLVFLYEKYKSVWAPIICHMCANCISLMFSTAFADVVSMQSQETLDTVTTAENVISLFVISVFFAILSAVCLIVVNYFVKPEVIE